MRKLAVFLALVMILGLTACNAVQKAPDNTGVPDKGDKGDKIVEPSPQTEEKEITLYFANKNYIQTGDEKLEKIIAEKRIIQYGNISLEEVVVRELMMGPKNNELSTGIPSGSKLLGVEVSDGTAFVNFAQEGLHGGSLQEGLTISQIVKSLTELENVDRVQFLIDGKKAETLMGHMSISESFEK